MIPHDLFSDLSDIKGFVVTRELNRVNAIQHELLRNKGVNSALVLQGCLMRLNQDHLETKYGAKGNRAYNIDLTGANYYA